MLIKVNKLSQRHTAENGIYFMHLKILKRYIPNRYLLTFIEFMSLKMFNK